MTECIILAASINTNKLFYLIQTFSEWGLIQLIITRWLNFGWLGETIESICNPKYTDRIGRVATRRQETAVTTNAERRTTMNKIKV